VLYTRVSSFRTQKAIDNFTKTSLPFLHSSMTTPATPTPEGFRTVTKHKEYYINGADLCLLVSFSLSASRRSFFLKKINILPRLRMSNSECTVFFSNGNLPTLFACWLYQHLLGRSPKALRIPTRFFWRRSPQTISLRFYGYFITRKSHNRLRPRR
jgi:hypothetical protein